MLTSHLFFSDGLNLLASPILLALVLLSPQQGRKVGEIDQFIKQCTVVLHSAQATAKTLCTYLPPLRVVFIPQYLRELVALGDKVPLQLHSL